MDAAIELVQLGKRFGSHAAVDGVSLRVPTGSCFGLIGPNGAGKTTTFSLMCGFLSPTSGSISLLGVSPSAPGALKGRVGVLPQDARLPQWEKVGSLMVHWARLSAVGAPEEAARECLRKVGMEGAWDTRCHALSHGMARRVGIAQALLGAPPVILLDEPTAGLDPRVAAELRALIRSLKGQHTLVISSHNLQELEELCDGAAILDKGRLVRAGPMSELTAQAEQFTVVLAGAAAPPLETLRALPGCADVTLEAGGRLVVQLDGAGQLPEHAIAAVLRALLDAGCLVSELHRGKRLEQRVLELT